MISLVGDGGFGQNPSMLATAVELDLGIIWLVMNNNAFGTIAGLQKAHYGLTYGTTFPGTPMRRPTGRAMPRSRAPMGRRVCGSVPRTNCSQPCRPPLPAASPRCLDVPMINNPTPTTGHWNILDIYSPDKDVSHVST